ncbi:hypothetical protein ACFRCG_35760 [Embleya sp. NPDC056575]|uniref:hypothetical protein n=1 Tax=unclassified Embleya TaxID=2699296 RepID=UPI00368301B9
MTPRELVVWPIAHMPRWSPSAHTLGLARRALAAVGFRVLTAAPVLIAFVGGVGSAFVPGSLVPGPWVLPVAAVTVVAVTASLDLLLVASWAGQRSVRDRCVLWAHGIDEWARGARSGRPVAEFATRAALVEDFVDRHGPSDGWPAETWAEFTHRLEHAVSAGVR